VNEREALHRTEIKHLAALAAVAKEPSFRAAARRLGCTQSVLIRHVAELERAFGTRLVDRAPRIGSLGLTEAGKLILVHANIVLARVDAARADLRAIAAPLPLRVGVYEAVATRVMPRVLAGLRGNAIDPREADDAELPARVAAADVDIAFAVLPLPAGPLASVRLLDEPYVLLVPAGSELARRSQAPSLAELAALPLLAPGSPSAEERVVSQLATGASPPRFVQRPGSDTSLRALVRAGAGVAVVPGLSVDPEDHATEAIDLGGILPPRTVVLVWHRYRRRREDALRFREAATLVCREIASAPGGWYRR